MSKQPKKRIWAVWLRSRLHPTAPPIYLGSELEYTIEEAEAAAECKSGHNNDECWLDIHDMGEAE